jgi:four helix bundle protein
MLNNNLYNKAYDFAVRIVKICEILEAKKRGQVLVRQLLRSGTSIGANVAEANGAISKADFSLKISIAYKESLETKYWISLMKDSGIINKELFEKIYLATEELSKILFSIIKSTRINKK